jgi:hypothetical protein
MWPQTKLAVPVHFLQKQTIEKWRCDIHHDKTEHNNTCHNNVQHNNIKI